MHSDARKSMEVEVRWLQWPVHVQIFMCSDVKQERTYIETADGHFELLFRAIEVHGIGNHEQ
jgi:hypothetical protein